MIRSIVKCQRRVCPLGFHQSSHHLGSAVAIQCAAEDSAKVGSSVGTVAAVGIAGLAAWAAAPTESQCESNGGWFTWLRSSSSPTSTMQAAIKQDPRTAVVVSYGIPLLSLTFGWTPTTKDMAAAEKAVAPHIATFLQPWEICILLWGVAHGGYIPSKSSMSACRDRLLNHVNALSAQEAAMGAWSLSVLGASQEYNDLFKALIQRVAALPVQQLDETVLVHLFQAALFADPADPSSSTADGAQAVLIASGAPPALADAALHTYTKEMASLPSFDGPVLVELSLVRMIETVMSSSEGQQQPGGVPLPYQKYCADLRKVDLQRAQQLREDRYLLQKLKRDVSDKFVHYSELGRRLAAASRTLKDLGVHSVPQTTVEDGLVAVDLALPDYKIAFFLEPHPPQPLHGASLSKMDTEGSGLAGYACSDTPGSRKCKLKVLQQHGWVALPISWEELASGSESERRRKMLELMERAGREHLMRGRVNAMVHGALRGAEESKLGGSRYGKVSVGAPSQR